MSQKLRLIQLKQRGERWMGRFGPKCLKGKENIYFELLSPAKVRRRVTVRAFSACQWDIRLKMANQGRLKISHWRV